MSVCSAGSVAVRLVSAECISAASELTAAAAVDSSQSLQSAASGDVCAIVRPVAVKLPLRVVSDRMNVDATLTAAPAAEATPQSLRLLAGETDKTS